MAPAKTWIWIIVGFVGVCVLALGVLAGTGVYFVAHHINITERTTTVDAQKTFDSTLATFTEPRPLFEIDSFDRAHPSRSTTDLPASSTKPDALWVLVWEPDRERLVRVSVPFWLLRFGRHKIDFGSSGDSSFDLDRLNLDVPELERVGSTVVLDYRARSGHRVLIWTR